MTKSFAVATLLLSSSAAFASTPVQTQEDKTKFVHELAGNVVEQLNQRFPQTWHEELNVTRASAVDHIVILHTELTYDSERTPIRAEEQGLTQDELITAYALKNEALEVTLAYAACKAATVSDETRVFLLEGGYFLANVNYSDGTRFGTVHINSETCKQEPMIN
ncbi:hypothetical protein [Vibrio ulleungensis]|uniref:Uncharacterized protein n=1 Tax=Vibrio ulleungensis TaxID=2807619 RepID=A0ABS2HI78_9VIBR|nr:hypothetical protein [Vibrio ulleungensis]MBM7037240.1 hypothetical protein [Vibrio ulleungensis]